MQYGDSGAFQNTSGQGAAAIVPSEIRGGFNWGAFLLNWIWTIGNTSCGFAVLSTVLSFIPLVGLGWAIYLGIRGNELAWRSKRWGSVEHFRRTQRTWTRVGIAVVLVSILITCVCGLLGGLAFVLDAGTTTGALGLPPEAAP